jgi:hypothetical protein
MGDVVNLRRARKAKARAEADAAAQHRRSAFGRTKADRILGDAERALADRRLDTHRRGDDGSETDQS